MRVTKKDIHLAFKRLCAALGEEIGYGEGQWYLDYTPLYGGWAICEVTGRGGESHPFGGMMNAGRMKTRTFYGALHLAVKVAEMSSSPDDRETAAVLAGLRLLQHCSRAGVLNPAEAFGTYEILTKGKTLKPMSIKEIAELYERINLGGLSVRSTD